jgi:hypothetical protein
MKPWHASARALPVTVRPLGGETVISYTRRLSQANELRPTTIMRALGQLSRPSGHYLLDHDAWLNDQALDRLEAYSGISRHRLTRALPALRQLPRSVPFQPTADRPVLYLYRPWPPACAACHRCTFRLSGRSGPPALIRPVASPLICRRDKRWLDEAAQYDLSAAREILAFHRRYTRLQAGNFDRQWVTVNFTAAWQIAQGWGSTAPGYFASPGDRWFPVLRKRWRARAEKLGIPPLAPAPAVVTFPEAVGLTEILTDLNWRRHVAMVRPPDLGRFYRRVAEHLGEPSYPDPPARSDPPTRMGQPASRPVRRHPPADLGTSPLAGTALPGNPPLQMRTLTDGQPTHKWRTASQQRPSPPD